MLLEGYLHFNFSPPYLLTCILSISLSFSNVFWGSSRPQYFGLLIYYFAVCILICGPSLEQFQQLCLDPQYLQFVLHIFFSLFVSRVSFMFLRIITTPFLKKYCPFCFLWFSLFILLNYFHGTLTTHILPFFLVSSSFISLDYWLLLQMMSMWERGKHLGLALFSMWVGGGWSSRQKVSKVATWIQPSSKPHHHSTKHSLASHHQACS